MLVVAGTFAGQLPRHAGLARPAVPVKGQEPVVPGAHETVQLGELEGTPDERRRVGTDAAHGTGPHVGLPGELGWGLERDQVRGRPGGSRDADRSAAPLDRA